MLTVATGWLLVALGAFVPGKRHLPGAIWVTEDPRRQCHLHQCRNAFLPRDHVTRRGCLRKTQRTGNLGPSGRRRRKGGVGAEPPPRRSPVRASTTSNPSTVLASKSSPSGEKLTALLASALRENWNCCPAVCTSQRRTTLRPDIRERVLTTPCRMTATGRGPLASAGFAAKTSGGMCGGTNRNTRSKFQYGQ